MISLVLNGIIVKGIGGFYYVEAAGKIYECKARGIFRKEKIIPLVGDIVTITVDDSGKNTIDSIAERRNSFNRPPISNVDKLIIVSSTCEPNPNLLIIDRLTAIAYYKKVTPVVVFTKNDLSSAESLTEIYKAAGIPTYSVSCKIGEGIDSFKKELDGCISVFTGNSGVGKSSLLNCIEPEFSLET